MSRICVKNLPKYVKNDRLKEFFSQKGEVTDARVIRKRTKDGKSRHFGFVGFRTEEEAQEAIKYFNRSFFDTFRINCEIALKIGDPDLPRPWSKYSVKTHEKLTGKGKEVNAKKDSGVHGIKRKEKKSKTNGEIDDPQLQEFLEVMKPHSKSKLWANDTIAAASFEQSDIASNRDIKTRILKDKSNVTDAKSDVTDEEDDLTSRSDEEEPQSVVHDTGLSDIDYFKSKIKEKWSDSESDEDDDNANQNDDADSLDGDSDSEMYEVKDAKSVHDQEPSKNTVDKLAGVSDPLSSSKNGLNEFDNMVRLFIRNLPYTATEEELEDHFSKHGDILKVHIAVDKETMQSKGFGFICFSLPESAARALEELDNSIFQGRLLHVMPANKKPHERQEGFNTLVNKSKTSFKKKREDERKEAEASGNAQAWNPSYIRSDTVVEYIARKSGVSKNEFLDVEAEDLAVRIALGETQVIAETKKAFAKAGGNITFLEEFAAEKSNNLKRSDHVILVKNLPYGSSESELAAMFGEKSRTLVKIILPPTKAQALIVFLHPNEARAAFNDLMYRRFKYGPLYLEWAPSDILAENDSINKTAVGEEEIKRALLVQEDEGLMDADIDHDRIESRQLYVKNLNFKTSDESLKKHFTELIKGRRILSVRVQKHLKNGKNVSKGFAFIEFDSVDTAVNVCRDLQGTVLDGHALMLQICHAKERPAAKKVENDKSSTKLIVRNVAFEATEKDIRQLFSTYGEIKSVRLPRGFRNHRGFSFVEFATKQEAQKAIQALARTHLYGRHLVLERAKEGESLEELRERTATQFSGSESQSGFSKSAKMSKKRKNLGAFDDIL